MFDFLLLITISFLGLTIYNRIKLKKIAKVLFTHPAIRNLNASELIYIKTNRLRNVIHGYLNNLVVSRDLRIVSENSFEAEEEYEQHEQTEFNVIMDVCNERTSWRYEYLLTNLEQKPIFLKVKNAVDIIKSTVSNSVSFKRQFFVNLLVLSIVSTVGLTRAFIGFTREKPIFFIVLINIVLIVISAIYLQYLYNNVLKEVSGHYEKEIIPKDRTHFDGWEWNYFLIDRLYYLFHLVIC